MSSKLCFFLSVFAVAKVKLAGSCSVLLLMNALSTEAKGDWFDVFREIRQITRHDKCSKFPIRAPHDQPLPVAGRANRAETLTAEVQDPRSVPHDRGAKSARRSSLSFHFNIIIPFAHTSLVWSLPFMFPH